MQSFTHEERVALTRLVFDVLSDWQVPGAGQIALLALPEDTRPRALRSYQHGEPLPDDPQTYERIEHIMGIADALRTSNPCNTAAGALWMHRTNPWFSERTPLATMLEDGLQGIIAVRKHLDCAYDWYVDTRENE